jgi:hypothetical protein
MIRLRLAAREFVDFENALAAQIAASQALHPEIAMEAVPMDLRTLYGELFTAGGLRSGKWNPAMPVTDWLSEAIALGARRLPRSARLPEFAEIINTIATRALHSEEPSASILAKAQREAQAKKIVLG